MTEVRASSQSKDQGSPHGPVEFRAIYEAESSYVWKTLRRIGVPERDLEDLLHDVFVVVFRRLHEYDAARPIKPWLFGIAFRVASDYRRSSRQTREFLEPAREIEDAAPGADERLAQARDRETVVSALGSLAPDRRAVFVMHDLDGHSAPDIAAALSIPTNTVYSRLRVAREEFAAAVRRLLLRRGQS